MNSLESVDQILRKAEQKVRELVATAATEGDYDSVSTLAEIAKRLRDLHVELLGSRAPLASAVPTGRKTREPPTLDPASTRTAKKRKAHGRNAGRGYPKFRIEGAHLVKIGWSKSAKSEYEHRAPREVVERLAAALAKVGASSTPISMDNLLPLEAVDGSEIPSYQAYLALAWLRSEGLVEAEGRKGYTLTTQHLLSDTRKQWNVTSAS